MLLAAFLRLWHVDAGWFGVDQARDLAWAETIASGEAFPVTGPPMRNRFHLGATYYWFWSLPAFVAEGPRAFYAFAALLGTASVLLAWLLARRLCGVPAGLAAAALLATCPVAVLDSRIAWAPAALPAWSALVLLLAAGFLRAPGTLRAAALVLVAALGTQLHVAALPLALLAASTVLLRPRVLGARGVVLVACAGLLPVAPMLLGWSAPDVAAAGEPVASDPRAHRVLDVLLLVPRVVAGLSPAARPRLVDAWLVVERAAVAITLAAVCWALLRPALPARATALRLVALAYLASLASVLLLPAEAWYYYLDAALVPGAVALGAAWQGFAARSAARLLLVAAVAARALLVVWWVDGTSSRGFVAASLDLLRLGGSRPVAAEARARLPSVATKEEAARVLASDLGIALERTWRDVHGSGFSDLDTDNGYFVHRAHRGADATRAAGAGVSAVVLYRGDFPADWLAGHARARFAGPLEIRAYSPSLRRESARLVGCGDGAVPEQPIPSPRAYGTGAPVRPQWPCADAIVQVDVAAPPRGTTLRVFARIDGAGRVLDLRADPPGSALASPAPGAGVGVELRPGPATLTVRLALDGPARLDLYELHGVR